MFDLYETETTGPDHSDESSSEEERPYRERHRVELRSQETGYGGGSYPDRYGRGVEADLLTGSAASRRRVVRGNAPGGRRTSQPGAPYSGEPAGQPRNNSVTAAGPGRASNSDRNHGNRELAADLFAPRGTSSGSAYAQGRYRAGRTADTVNPAPQGRYRTGQTADRGYNFGQSPYRSGRGVDPGQNRNPQPQWGAQVRNDNRPRPDQRSGSALQEWDNIGPRRTGAPSRGTAQDRRSQGTGRTQGAFRFPTDLENQPPSGGRGLPVWNRPSARTPYRDERDEFAPDEDLYTDFSGSEAYAPEEDEVREEGARRRQRLVQRRDRERELRRTWLILGGSALAALLVLILIIHTVVGLLHKNKPSPADAGRQTASAQEESVEGQPQDSAGTGQDPDAVSASADAETGTDGADAQTGDAETPAGADAAQAEAGQDQADTETAAETGTETETEQGPGNDAGTQTPEGQAPAENPAASGEIPAETPAEGAEPSQTSPDVAAQAEAGAGTQVTASGASGAAYAGQDDWRLILVNPWHHLPEGYNVETTTLTNGESVDSRCYQALMDMLEDCRAGGGTPIVCSSYRPHEKQVTLFENQVKPLMAAGMTREEAEKEAGTVVAVPGTSEHELGLAVDICDTNNQLLDASQADTPTQKWLMAHCWDYGFILRYPEDKSDVTGIIYEPWHYRYVGTEAAAQIRDRGICLEEYLTQN